MNDLVDKANGVLAALIEKTREETAINWKQSIRDIYGPDSIDTANRSIKSVLSFLDKTTQNQRHPQHVLTPRVLPMSIADISDAYLEEEIPSDCVKIISLLKETKRIMQLGGGKGKAIVMIDSRLIGYGVGIKILDKPPVDSSDPIALLKALKDTLGTTEEDVKVLKKKTVEQARIIKEQTETIKHLNGQLVTADQRSWY